MSHINRITSSAVSRHQHASAAKVAVHRGFPLINSVLGVAVIGLVLTYVVCANAVAAQTWRKQDAQTQLSSLRDERNNLTAQASQLDDRIVLEQLAQGAGMVSAGSVVYLVQDRAVAAR